MASSRPLPTGRCNYQNLNVKTTDYNTHCGCQMFWEEEKDGQELTSETVSSSLVTSVSETAKDGDTEGNGASARSSSAGKGQKSSKSKPRRRGLCVCGHHQCFHSFHSIPEDQPSDRQRYPTEPRFHTPPKQQDNNNHDALVNLSKTFDDRAALERQEEAELSAAHQPEWNAMGLGPGKAFANSDGLGLSFTALQNRRQTPSNRNSGNYEGYNRREGYMHQQTSEGTLQAGITAPSPVPSSSVTEVATNISFVPAQHFNPNISMNQPYTSSPLQRAVQQRQLVQNAPQYPSPRQYNQYIQDVDRSPRVTNHHLQHQPPRAPPLILHDVVAGTPTVVDSPLVTNPSLHFNISHQAMGAFRALNQISMSLVPPYAHHPNQMQAPSSPTGRVLTEVPSPESQVSEEVTRKAMAAEGAAKDLLQCLEWSRSQIQSDSSHRVTPQKSSSSSNGHPSSSLRPPSSSPPKGSAITPSSAKSAVSHGSMFSSIPPPRLDPAEVSLRAQLQLLKEKYDGLEDAVEDAANRAELAEDKVMDMEGRMVHVEDKIDGVAESFSRHKDASSSSLGKRSRENNAKEDDGDYTCMAPSSKHKGKRRKQKAAESTEPTRLRDKADQPDSSMKQVTTTTTTSFTTSTCTSFASNCSSESIASYQTERLLASILTQVKKLSSRISVLEDLAPPTVNRPFVVEVVVLPASTWAVWKRQRQDGNLVLKSHAPRAQLVNTRGWLRLLSRGLIKTLQVVGGEARDFERAIKKNFGGIFRALRDTQGSHSRDDISYQWSPLRKAKHQNNLRFLAASEMETQGLWKIDFLKRTCAAELTPSPSSQSPNSQSGTTTQSHTLVSGSSPRPTETKKSNQPTHRLYITNCWTSPLSPEGWDDLSEYTQMSARASAAPPNLRRRASSVASTQRSSLAGTLKKTRTGGLPTDDESIAETPFAFGLNETGELGGGWDDIKKLPRYREAESHGKSGAEGGSPEPFWDFDETLDGPAVVDSSEDDPSFTSSSTHIGRITVSSDNTFTTSSGSSSNSNRVIARRPSRYRRESIEASIGNSGSYEHFHAQGFVNDESPLRREVFEEANDDDAEEPNCDTPRPSLNTVHSAPTPQSKSPAHWKLSQLSSTRPGSYPIGNQYTRRYRQLRSGNVLPTSSSEATAPNRGAISSEGSRLTDQSANDSREDDEGVGDEVEAEGHTSDNDDEERRMRSRSPTEEI